MDREKREKIKEINRLRNEIEELEDFLDAANRVWTCKLTLKSIITNTFGLCKNKKFNMNKFIKNRVLLVLEEYKNFLEKDLDKLLQGDE